jgi:hypothetical protein
MRVDNMIVRAHDQEDTRRNRTLVGLGPNYVHAVHQPTPNRSRATGGGRPSHGCHTRFYKENRMHLICAPGSNYTHTIDKRV